MRMLKHALPFMSPAAPCSQRVTQATSLDGITFAFQVPPNVSPGDIIQVRLTAFDAREVEQAVGHHDKHRRAVV